MQTHGHWGGKRWSVREGQGTKRITGQYSLLRTSAPQEVLVRTGQHWSVYTREASEIFKLSGC